MGKMLKAEEKNRVLSDAEVIEIVKSYSARYKALDVYTGLNDTDFFGAYLHFNESHLPNPNVSFKDEKFPQITSNMFAIMESKICKDLQEALLQRFELIKSYNKGHKDSVNKSMMGKALLQKMK